jgi:uncharacterized protein (TIRG00374 family)
MRRVDGSSNGTDDVTDATGSGEKTPTFGFGSRQIVALVVTLVVLVIVFARVLPQLGDYSQAWDAIQDMSTGRLVALIGATVAVILIYVWPYQAALPGLGYRQGFVVRQTSFMVSNAIPAGGAIGLGVQYDMLSGYGYRLEPATAAIGITGAWNTFITLSLPILAVAGLAVTGEVSQSATIVAIVGLAVIAVAVLLFALILRKEETARRIGDWGGRVLSRLARLIRKDLTFDVAQSVVDFRGSVVGVISERWLLITAANLGQQLAQFAVLWLALVAVQGGSSSATIVQAFAAFAVARLATFLPVPPGGLGTTDAALTALLQGFGVADDLALAAVLIWRAATYFPQIFIGIGTFLVWRVQRHRSRAAAG